MPVSFVAASAIAVGAVPTRRSAGIAYVTGVLVFAPFPFLVTLFVLPGLAWLALFGLAVPAALVEKLSLGRALARGLELARADYVHVLGGIAALALIVLLTQAGSSSSSGSTRRTRSASRPRSRRSWSRRCSSSAERCCTSTRRLG